MRHCRKAAGEFTRKSSAAESANFRATGVPDAGKKKICRVSCVDLHLYVQRVSVIGVPDGLSDGEGVVATFFLIRYQSVVASRREINFACQLFRISFFIGPLQQNFANPLVKTFRGKTPFDPPAVTNGNSTGLLRNDHGNRVRFFRQTEPGAMTQSEAAIERLTLTNRKNTGRGRNAAIANNDAAIVQGCFGMKDGQHQLDGK